MSDSQKLIILEKRWKYNNMIAECKCVTTIYFYAISFQICTGQISNLFWKIEEVTFGNNWINWLVNNNNLYSVLFSLPNSDTVDSTGVHYFLVKCSFYLLENTIL